MDLLQNIFKLLPGTNHESAIAIFNTTNAHTRPAPNHLSGLRERRKKLLLAGNADVQLFAQLLEDVHDLFENGTIGVAEHRTLCEDILRNSINYVDMGRMSSSSQLSICMDMRLQRLAPGISIDISPKTIEQVRAIRKRLMQDANSSLSRLANRLEDLDNARQTRQNTRQVHAHRCRVMEESAHDLAYKDAITVQHYLIICDDLMAQLEAGENDKVDDITQTTLSKTPVIDSCQMARG